MFRVSFGSGSWLPPESIKMEKEAPQARKQFKKGFQNGARLAWQNGGKGVDK